MAELTGSGHIDLGYLHAAASNLPPAKQQKEHAASLASLREVARGIGYDVTIADEQTVIESLQAHDAQSLGGDEEQRGEPSEPQGAEAQTNE